MLCDTSLVLSQPSPAQSATERVMKDDPTDTSLLLGRGQPSASYIAETTPAASRVNSEGDKSLSSNGDHDKSASMVVIDQRAGWVHANKSNAGYDARAPGRDSVQYDFTINKAIA